MNHSSQPSLPFKVLFVCMGNICRSPAAEIIFMKMIQENHLQNKITTDSAGTIAYHEGAQPDKRMGKTLKEFGYTDPGLRARKITTSDLKTFDLIITMDDDNLREVRKLDPARQYWDKIQPMCQFATKFEDKVVPDPYYGGEEGFVHVVELLEDTCEHLLTQLKKQFI